jgi:aspartate kinase
MQAVEQLKEQLPDAEFRLADVAIVSVLGSNMKSPGWLALAAGALARGEVNILALDQSMRQVNMQFIIGRNQFETAQRALHAEFIESR